MKEQDKYFAFETLVTTVLFYITISLFGERLSQFKLFLVLGLITGFAFSWLTKTRPKVFVRIAVDICSVLVFAWMVYSVWRSSFFYKEVIWILIKGVFFFVIVLSFNSATPSYLTCIQSLSIPIFMSYPLFVKSDSQISPILIMAYLIVWFAILKVKFFEFIRPTNRKESRNNYYISAIPLILFFIINVLVAWILASNLSLSNLKKGGILPEEDIGVTAELEDIEKEYYETQDKFQEDTTRLMLDLNRKEDRYDVLAWVNAMIKDSSQSIEVNRASQGLITRLNSPGLGLEDADTDEITYLIKKYLEQKIIINLKRAKDSFIDILRKNPLSLNKRIRMLNLANKVKYSKSHKSINKDSSELASAINRSDLEGEAKSDLKGSLRQLKDWRVFALYRQKISSLKGQSESLNKPEKDKFDGLIDSLEKASSLDQFEQLDDKINGLKELSRTEFNNFNETVQEAFALKLEMLLSKESAEAKNKIEESSLSQEKQKSFSESVDDFRSAETGREVADSLSQLQQQRKDAPGIANKEIEQLQETKLYSLQKERHERIEEALETSTLPVPDKQSFTDNVDKLAKETDTDKANSKANKLISDAERFHTQGYIYESTKNNLKEEIEDLKNIITAKNSAEEQSTKKEELSKEVDKSSSDKKVSPAAKEATTGQEEKSKDYAGSQERKLVKIKINPEYLKVYLGEAGQFTAQGVYSDNSQEDLTAQAQWSIENKRIADVSKGRISTLSTGETNIYAVFENIKSNPGILIVEAPRLLSIILYPQNVRMSPRYKFNFKAEGYYSNSSRRDITDLVSWNISNQHIIKMEKSLVRPVAFGHTQVTAQYQGIVSLPADISVIFTFGWLMFMLIKVFIWLVLLILALLFVSFIMTERKKQRLMAQRKLTNAFIVELYGNLRKVFSIFGLKDNPCMTPLDYSDRAEEKYSINDNLLQELTVKFEEAKYSKHLLLEDDAYFTVHRYNDVLKVLFTGCNKLSLGFKYCLSLLLRTPLLINQERPDKP